MRKEVIGNATLYHGNAAEMAPAGSVLITDPPYGFGAYRTDDDSPVVGVLGNWARRAFFGYPEVLCRWCASFGEPDEWVTWWPTNKPGGRSRGLGRDSEAIAIYGPLFEIPTRERSGDAMTRKIALMRGNEVEECKEGDVWRDPSPGAGFNRHLRHHPNEKPVSVMQRLVALCSEPGELVADAFMGSGTTGVACLLLGRPFVGIELDADHFEVACKRIEDAQRQARMFG